VEAQVSGTPAYRFKLEIVDETTGDVIVSDFCSLTSIDQFGGCESVDMHAAAALRFFNTVGRSKHEAENYPKNDQQLVTQTAARVLAAAKG
jgi:hypothetical protein